MALGCGGRLIRGGLGFFGLLLVSSQSALETHAQDTLKTVGDIQSQLLIADGIAPDSTIRVFSDLTSFLDTGESANLNLTVPHVGGLTVSSSVLLMNSESKQSTGDTQVYYKCTTVPNVWNYSQDANIDATAVPEVTFVDTSATNTSVLTRFTLLDCANSVDKFAVGEIVLGNSFFGSFFETNEIHFRVTESAVDSTSATSCVMRLALTRAALAELFADCTVKFKTVNATNLFVGSAITSNNQDTSAVQVLVKDPACEYECGVAVTLQSDLYTAGLPGLSQCYDCSTEFVGTACPETYPYTTATECCQRRDCVSQSVKPKVPELITWNLAADGVSVLQSVFKLYESGDCSNPASLSSTCCLITCRNCFLALDVDSLSFQYTTSTTTHLTAGDIILSGQGSLNFVVVAPNGCSAPNVFDKINIPVSTITTKKWGLSLTLALQLTQQKQLAIRPHAVSDVGLGSTFRVNGFRGAFTNSATSIDGTIDFSSVDTPKQASLDMAFRAGIAFQVTGSVGFLDSAASIRVGVKSGAFLNAKSSVDVTSQFPQSSQAKLTSASVKSTGDCQLAHFMEYEISSVVNDTQILYGSALVNRDLDGDITKSVSSSTATKSQVSGCVAMAYTSRFKLSVQLAAAQALIDDSSRQDRLVRALPRGLSFLDLDPAMITILSISPDDGTVEVEIAVPPSIQADFADAALFAGECNARARTDKFKRLISGALALPVNAYCAAGSWGVACDQDCTTQGCTVVHLNCVRAMCDAVTGTITKCDKCVSTKWGATCDIGCLPPAKCVAANCDQQSGTAYECLGCESGYWGKMCSNLCASSTNCLYPRCLQASGLLTSCGTCKDGFWGEMCVNSCAASDHCTSMVCEQSTGALAHCPSCEKGWKGTTCKTSGAAQFGVALNSIAVTALGGFLLA